MSMMSLLFLSSRIVLAQCASGTAPEEIPAGTAIAKTSLSDGGTPDDFNAPAVAVIGDVHFQFPKNTGPSPARHSCPQLDYLSFTVTGDDDVTDAAALRLAVFVGADAATALSANTAPSNLLKFQSVVYRRIAVTLGNSEGHERDGVGLRTKGPFCFSIALVDASANIGPRSEVTCLDTTSTTDPLLEYYNEPVGCGCEGSPGSLGFTGALLALCLRRRSRRD